MLNKMQYLAISLLWLILTQVQATQTLDGTSFITKWKTYSNGDSVYLPINPDYSYNANIDCDNDGIFEKTGVTDHSNMFCSYAKAGEYIIAVSGEFPAFNLYLATNLYIYFNPNEYVLNTRSARYQLLEVMQWGNIQWQTMDSAFYEAINFQITATDQPILDAVSNMSLMFCGASVFNQDISAWDVSHVTDMTRMFIYATQFNQALNRWDVGNVVNMEGMFEGATAFNQDISAWNVSNVINMWSMFKDATAFNQDIDVWDVSNVTNMQSMFEGATHFNGNITHWNVSNVNRMDRMFADAKAFNQDIGDWNVHNAAILEMFAGASAFNQDIGAWDVSQQAWMNGVFERATSFNQDLSAWDVSNAVYMERFFKGASAFNQDLSTWNVSRVARMDYMFQDASAFNGDISTWNVSNVTDMPLMFSGATAFNGDIRAWNVSNVTGMSAMFRDASQFNQDLSSWNVGQVRYTSQMFKGASRFNTDISTWDVSQVMGMEQMFAGAYAFNVDISAWDVSNVIRMSEMFAGAVSFDQDLSRWDIRNVIDMFDVFASVTLSTSHYEALLQAWSQLPPPRNLLFDAGNSQYTANSVAEQARTALINNYGWTISDGGYTSNALPDETVCGKFNNVAITITDTCQNQGWLFDVNIAATGSVIGGKLAGVIDNQGLIQDAELRHVQLDGGTLSGHIVNHNHAYNNLLNAGTENQIKNVTLTAETVLYGGRVSGYINGNPIAPALLNHVYIDDGSYLSHVVIEHSGIVDDYAQDLSDWLFDPIDNEFVLGQGVRFAEEFPCEGNGLSSLRNIEPNACFTPYADTLRITTAPEHRGQTAEVVFLARDDTYTYSYDGKFWQGNAEGEENMINAKTIAALPLTLEVPLPNLDSFNEVFVGYRLSDGDIIYTQVK